MSSMERMRRASGLSLESAPASFHQDDDMQLDTSMSFTAGGSLQYKGFKINDKGVQMSPDGPAPMSGITLSDLKMGEVLGRGSSATVRKAIVKSGQNGPTTLAVKIMDTVYNADLRKQLLAELQWLMPKLHANPSPHIVRIYEVLYEKEDDRLYILLELCEAGSLDDCIKKNGPAPEHILSVITRQLFVGLVYLFVAGIQHRDLKPANIMLTLHGDVKISDFGSSKADPRAETFVGTTRYMSPERLNGESYGWPADVWGAGLTVLETAVGEHPYKAFGQDSSFVAMIEYATHRDTPPLPASFSEEAREFVELCLDKDPEARPSPPQLLFPHGGDTLESAHPFIADHAALPNMEAYRRVGRQVVTTWMGNQLQRQAAQASGGGGGTVHSVSPQAPESGSSGAAPEAVLRHFSAAF